MEPSIEELHNKDIRVTYRDVDITNVMFGWCHCYNCTKELRACIDKAIEESSKA